MVARLVRSSWSTWLLGAALAACGSQSTGAAGIAGDSAPSGGAGSAIAGSAAAGSSGGRALVGTAGAGGLAPVAGSSVGGSLDGSGVAPFNGGSTGALEAGCAAGLLAGGGAPAGGAGVGGAGVGGAPGTTDVKIALQGYSIKDKLNQSFNDTVKSLKQMGYDGVELPGDVALDNPAGKKAYLDSIGFRFVGSHWWGTDISGVDGPANWSLQAGASLAVLRWPDGDTEGLLRAAAPKFKAKGLQLCYHNHDQDIRDLDRWLGSNADLNAELDCAWANIGGYPPVQFLNKWRGRVSSIHLKDYDSKHGNVMKVLGQGDQDIAGICKAAIAAGVSWIIYEDESGMDGMQSAQIGREYLRHLGY